MMCCDVKDLKFPGELRSDGIMLMEAPIKGLCRTYIEGAGDTVTYSSTDKPELNGITERKYCTAGKMNLTTLIR
jgi:hypothetical protein